MPPKSLQNDPEDFEYSTVITQFSASFPINKMTQFESFVATGVAIPTKTSIVIDTLFRPTTALILQYCCPVHRVKFRSEFRTVYFVSLA